MGPIRLSKANFSLKLLITFAILGMCLTYSILVAHIFIDTEFQVSNIEEAYSTFDWIELVDQTHKYLPYYGIYLFVRISEEGSSASSMERRSLSVSIAETDGDTYFFPLIINLIAMDNWSNMFEMLVIFEHSKN